MLKEDVHAHRCSIKAPVTTAQLVQLPMVVDAPHQTDAWTMRSAELLLTATDANHAVLEQLQTSQAQSAFNPQVQAEAHAHQAVQETERSTTGIRLDASAATHTPEPREATPSAWLMTAAVTRSSHGLVHARLAKMAWSQIPTEEAAFVPHPFD